MINFSEELHELGNSFRKLHYVVGECSGPELHLPQTDLLDGCTAKEMIRLPSGRHIGSAALQRSSQTRCFLNSGGNLTRWRNIIWISLQGPCFIRRGGRGWFATAGSRTPNSSTRHSSVTSLIAALRYNFEPSQLLCGRGMGCTLRAFGEMKETRGTMGGGQVNYLLSQYSYFRLQNPPTVPSRPIVALLRSPSLCACCAPPLPPWLHLTAFLVKF